MKNTILPLMLLIANIGFAQIDSSKSNLSFSGYAEVYYSYDFNKPADHNRPAFFYSHNRHNEFNLNLGYI
ncbi:MAG: outer membrane beta-barrel protein, partial [Saprospiraceae bacterium]